MGACTMTRRFAAVFLAAVTVYFAGCLADQAATPASTTFTPTPTAAEPTDVSPTTTTDSPTPAATAEQARPQPNLTADVTNGTVPLDVTFTLADDGGADGDWVLDFGDGNSTNGTGIPTAASHQYLTAGNHTVTFTLTIGEASESDTLSILAEAAVALGDGQHVEGSWLAGLSGCAASWDPWVFGTPLDGVMVVEFDVDPASIGTGFLATFTLEGPSPGLFVGADFYDADGAYVDGVFTVDLSPPAGTVPAGAVLGLLYACNAQGGSVVYDSGLAAPE